jgi:hypothetical protein
MVRSNTVAVVVRAPIDPAEEEISRLTMDLGVGCAFAFGDYGIDEAAREKLGILASKYVGTQTGAAAALTLANAYGHNLRDLYKGGYMRKTDKKAARAQFQKAAKLDPGTLVRLATAVAAPTEASAPVLDQAANHLKQIALGATVESAAAGETTMDAASATAAGDALDMLNDFRRAFAQRS